MADLDVSLRLLQSALGRCSTVLPKLSKVGLRTTYQCVLLLSLALLLFYQTGTNQLFARRFVNFMCMNVVVLMAG